MTNQPYLSGRSALKYLLLRRIIVVLAIMAALAVFVALFWLSRQSGVAVLPSVVSPASSSTSASLPEAGKSFNLADFATGAMESLEPESGLSLPDGNFYDSSAMEVKLTQWQGQVVLVNLWAQWCAPCIEELPALAALAMSFERKDLAVIAIGAGRESERETTREALTRLVGNRLDFYFDPKWVIARQAKAFGVPTSIIYDRNGNSVARLSGAAKWDSPEAKALIAAIAAK